MKVEFQLTVDDYVDAQKAHLRKRLGKKMIAVFAIPVLAAILYGFVLVNPSHELYLQLRPFGYLALGVLFLIGYVWSGIPYRFQFRRLNSLHSPWEIEAGVEGMDFTSITAHTHRTWRGFEDFRETPSNFLLYPQPSLFFIVPKRVLSAEQISEFRNLVLTSIKRR